MTEDARAQRRRSQTAAQNTISSPGWVLFFASLFGKRETIEGKSGRVTVMVFCGRDYYQLTRR